MNGSGRPEAVKLIDELMAMRRSTSINWEGVLARQYTRLLRSPRTIVDVGAHQGAHTAHFVSLGAQRVVCFEPIPSMAAALRQKFAAHPVEVHATALSASNGQSEFVHDITVPSESGLKERRAPEFRPQEQKTIVVETRTMDSFEFSGVDFVKIDCEGAELHVLHGGGRTIMRERPVMSVEHGWSGYSAYGFAKMDLLGWAVAQGYTVSDLFGHSLQDPECFDYCVDRFFWDFFLVPNERWDQVGASLRLQPVQDLIEA